MGNESLSIRIQLGLMKLIRVNPRSWFKDLLGKRLFMKIKATAVSYGPDKDHILYSVKTKKYKV